MLYHCSKLWPRAPDFETVEAHRIRVQLSGRCPETASVALSSKFPPGFVLEQLQLQLLPMLTARQSKRSMHLGCCCSPRRHTLLPQHAPRWRQERTAVASLYRIARARTAGLHAQLSKHMPRAAYQL